MRSQSALNSSLCKDRLPRLDLLTLVGVLDFQLAGQLAQNVFDLRQMRGERLRQREGVVLQRSA